MNTKQFKAVGKIFDDSSLAMRAAAERAIEVNKAVGVYVSENSGKSFWSLAVITPAQAAEMVRE